MADADRRERLWTRDGFAEDRWESVPDGEALPDEGAVIVSSARLEEARETNALDLGVALEPGEPVEDIVEHLPRLSLVSLPFPAFTDGRSYSAARLLRERHGFKGEIRARGDVLIDQIPLMLRCGFDAFVVSHGPTLRALEDGRLPEVPLYLQPVGERDEARVGARPWLRRRTKKQQTEENHERRSHPDRCRDHRRRPRRPVRRVRARPSRHEVPPDRHPRSPGRAVRRALSGKADLRHSGLAGDLRPGADRQADGADRAVRPRVPFRPHGHRARAQGREPLLVSTDQG